MLAFDLIDVEHRVDAEDEEAVLLLSPSSVWTVLVTGVQKTDLASPLTLGDMRRSPHYPAVQLTPLVECSVPLRGQLVLLGVK